MLYTELLGKLVLVGHVRNFDMKYDVSVLSFKFEQI